MNLSCYCRFILLACSACFFDSAQAATIIIDNNDTAGVGFNDPTPVSALASNPGTTLGAQRLYVFQKAADQWGALLRSSVPIHVRANFENLTCDATSATLGSAGTTGAYADFSGAPFSNTWYPVALANALSGIDRNGATAEISARFNLALDAGLSTCLGGQTWWYGTSSSDTVPSNKTPLLPVVFHELAHGLGFQTITNTSTGAFNGGTPDIWARFLADATSETTPPVSWLAMPSNAARAASAISDPNLVWTGPAVTAAQSQFLGRSPVLDVLAPSAIMGTYPAVSATFGPTLTSPGISGDIVLAVDPADASGPSTLDACSAISNAGGLVGRIALINRGTCAFTVKVKNAQNAGAIAVLIDHNVSTGFPGMGGTDATITIPSYGITQNTGDTLRGRLALSETITVNMTLNPQLDGTRRGYVRMNAPNPLAPGSSVSHFTSDAFPNLLMEPALNRTIFDTVDLTLALFSDIGWPLNDPLFLNGFE